MALIKHHYPIPLVNKLKALLSFQLTKEAPPPTPIVYVDKHLCKLSNNSMKARNMGLIPLLLMILFTVPVILKIISIILFLILVH